VGWGRGARTSSTIASPDSIRTTVQLPLLPGCSFSLLQSPPPLQTNGSALSSPCFGAPAPVIQCPPLSHQHSPVSFRSLPPPSTRKSLASPRFTSSTAPECESVCGCILPPAGGRGPPQSGEMEEDAGVGYACTCAASAAAPGSSDCSNSSGIEKDAPSPLLPASSTASPHAARNSGSSPPPLVSSSSSSAGPGASL
jgi:hypothetical protein